MVLMFHHRQKLCKESPSVLRFLRHWNKLSVRVGLLYRVSKNVITKNKTFQFIVPSALRDKVLKGVHDEAGHQGQHRTLYLTRRRFYWQGMEKEVKEYVRCCRRCAVSKSPEPDARAPLESIRTSRPLELVCVDFWLQASACLPIRLLTTLWVTELWRDSTAHWAT